MAKYQEWSEEAMAKSPESAVVFFTSGYGFSERLAQALELGIAKTGVEVDLVDLSTADTQVELLHRKSYASRERSLGSVWPRQGMVDAWLFESVQQHLGGCWHQLVKPVPAPRRT